MQLPANIYSIKFFILKTELSSNTIRIYYNEPYRPVLMIIKYFHLIRLFLIE